MFAHIPATSFFFPSKSICFGDLFTNFYLAIRFYTVNKYFSEFKSNFLATDSFSNTMVYRYTIDPTRHKFEVDKGSFSPLSTAGMAKQDRHLGQMNFLTFLSCFNS